MVIATFMPIKVVFWSHSLVVMTPDFESGNRGSNPCGTFDLNWSPISVLQQLLPLLNCLVPNQIRAGASPAVEQTTVIADRIKKQNALSKPSPIPHGLVVRIRAFHARGQGSIPCGGD